MHYLLEHFYYNNLNVICLLGNKPEMTSGKLRNCKIKRELNARFDVSKSINEQKNSLENTLFNYFQYFKNIITFCYCF